MSVKKIITFILDIIYPRRCVACGTYQYDICPKCLHKIPLRNDFIQSWIIGCLDYRDSAVRAIIRHLKNYHNESLVQKIIMGPIGNSITEHIAEITQFYPLPIMIIPIPIFKTRMKERGFNQAELLGVTIAHHLGTSVTYNDTILWKIKETRKQALITDDAERAKNITGCFFAHQNSCAGYHIILIDDVTTTGATLEEARRACLRAGASHVSAIALAH